LPIECSATKHQHRQPNRGQNDDRKNQPQSSNHAAATLESG